VFIVLMLESIKLLKLAKYFPSNLLCDWIYIVGLLHIYKSHCYQWSIVWYINMIVVLFNFHSCVDNTVIVETFKWNAWMQNTLSDRQVTMSFQYSVVCGLWFHVSLCLCKSRLFLCLLIVMRTIYDLSTK